MECYLRIELSDHCSLLVDNIHILVHISGHGLYKKINILNGTTITA